MKQQSNHFALDASNTRINAFVITIAAIAAVAGILFGFDTGVISGAILFIRKSFHLSTVATEIAISAVLLGALFSSAISGWFADFFGRRNILIIASIVFLFGTLGSAFSQNIVDLVLSRFVVGLAIGIASYVAPLYLSEISPAKWRGALVSLNQLAITVGIFLAYLIDDFFATDAHWRWMFAMGVIPALMLFVGMLFLPKSPRWLMHKGRENKARNTLKRIRQVDNVDSELSDIKGSLKRTNWKLLLQKWVWPAVIIGAGLAFFQQCTGINTIIYYAPTIFQLAGFKTAAGAIQTTTIVGLVNVLFTIIALPLIDRLGRRPLLLFGLTGMILSLIAMSLAFYIGTDSPTLKWLAFGSMMLYIPSFAISLGPIMWLIITEVFPLEIRGVGTSLMVSLSWGFNFIIAQTFLTLIQGLGARGTFMIYASISILGWLFVYFLIPETKGISLENIEANLRAGLGCRHLGNHR